MSMFVTNKSTLQHRTYFSVHNSRTCLSSRQALQSHVCHKYKRPLQPLAATGSVGDDDPELRGNGTDKTSEELTDEKIVVDFFTGKTSNNAAQQDVNTTESSSSSSLSSVDMAAEDDRLEGIEPPKKASKRGASKAPKAAKKESVASSSSDASSNGNGNSIPTSTEEEQKSSHKRHVHALKDRLVEAVASLDRGFAADKESADKVDNLVRELQAAAGVPILNHACKKLLDGRWRLIYSSGFASQSLGGARPGPPSALFPATLGQVYQDIDLAVDELDNCVEFKAKFSLANLPGFSTIAPPEVKAKLKHTFVIEGANTVKITYIGTSATFEGGVGNWLGSLPVFKTPEFTNQIPASYRGGSFDVVFLDETMRVTRGDRGEVRVFLKGEF